MVKIKAALFDLDGVVVDTEDSYTEFWNAQGEKYHPEIPNFALGRKGSTLAQVFDKFFSLKAARSAARPGNKQTETKL